MSNPNPWHASPEEIAQRVLNTPGGLEYWDKMMASKFQRFLRTILPIQYYDPDKVNVHSTFFAVSPKTPDDASILSYLLRQCKEIFVRAFEFKDPLAGVQKIVDELRPKVQGSLNLKDRNQNPKPNLK